MLTADSVSQVRECATVVGEEEADVRMADEDTGVDDACDGAGGVEGELLDDCVTGSVARPTIKYCISDLHGPKFRCSGMIVSAG
jgi:hypothetical protein